MTNRLLWLFSYIGLGFAIALGNRHFVDDHDRISRYHRRNVGPLNAMVGNVDPMMNDDAIHMNGYPYEYGVNNHDWVMYEKDNPNNIPNERTEGTGYENYLLDNILAKLLNNFYRRHIMPTSSHEFVPFMHSDMDTVITPEELLKRLFGQEFLMSAELLPLLSSSDSMYLGSGASLSQPQFRINDSPPRRPAAFAKSSSFSFSQPSHDDSSGFGPARSEMRRRSHSYRSRINPGDSLRSPRKRNQIPLSQQESSDPHQSPQMAIAAATAGLASQFMLRAARGNRQYDVPQIECPLSEDGMERFACPTADRMGRYRCIDDHVLCDGFIDCPTGEDEDRQACMFYKTTKAHLDVLADALLRWARGR